MKGGAVKFRTSWGPPGSVVNFANESVLGKGVEKADDVFMSDCDCREDYGWNCGCEYRSSDGRNWTSAVKESIPDLLRSIIP